MATCGGVCGLEDLKAAKAQERLGNARDDGCLLCDGISCNKPGKGGTQN